MSLELGIALVVTLFLGATALWLAYRSLRGHRGRQPFKPSVAVSEPMRSSRLVPGVLEARVGSDVFWVCVTCRSLNRREANRCYGCRTAKGIAGRQAPGQLPVSPGFPVMAKDIAGRHAPGQLPVRRGVPVMAKGRARSSGEAAGTTAALAAPRNAPPAPEIRVRASGQLLSAAMLETPAGVPVCPFLGFRDDPSTRYDYPDPRNMCHATSGRGATSGASPRRILAGTAATKRPQPIGAEHQKSHCLTAAHRQCARYPAIEVVAANR